MVKAKAGGGSATLSMAFAGAEFADSVMRGLDGEDGVVSCCFVESDVTDAPFFATKVTLGVSPLPSLPSMVSGADGQAVRSLGTARHQLRCGQRGALA